MNGFINDIDECLAEIEALDTGPFFSNNNPTTLAYEILHDTSLVTKYGNKVVSTYNGLCKAIEKASVDYNESVIDIVQKNYSCTKQQAISKLALAWNIRAKDGKGVWFKEQYAIISHNKAILDNPESIKDKYPLLYKQITGARTKKYYDFIIDLFMNRLEASGLFYLGCDKPLIASASKRFTAKVMRVKRNRTALDNMNDLDRFGMVKKLLDDDVMSIDCGHYEKVMSLKTNNGNTINSYQLIKWTDDVLSKAEEHIAYGKTHGMTHKSQNGATLSAHGYDTIGKGNDELNDDDATTFALLEKWARNKFRSSRGVITNKEWTHKFNEFEKQTYGQERTKKSDRLKSYLIAKLDLIQIMATKDNMNLFGGVNSKKFDGIAHNSKMMVKKSVYEELIKK